MFSVYFGYNTPVCILFTLCPVTWFAEYYQWAITYIFLFFSPYHKKEKPSRETVAVRNRMISQHSVKSVFHIFRWIFFSFRQSTVIIKNHPNTTAKTCFHGIILTEYSYFSSCLQSYSLSVYSNTSSPISSRKLFICSNVIFSSSP